MVNKSDVLQYLETHQDVRGIAHWRAHHDGRLSSYGVGLTKLRKYAKSIGRNATLARELWQADVYEMKVVSLLIDDPKTITIEQAEAQVEQLQGGNLAHVFSSCDATLAKAPFVVELADRWMASGDPVRRRCGYGLLYELSKRKNKSAPDDAYFLRHIDVIDNTFESQPMPVLMAMGGALMGIGKRNKVLHGAALALARHIGPIDFDPDGRCEPMDIEKHLTGDYVREKLGLC